jgi:hypothetical protein
LIDRVDVPEPLIVDVLSEPDSPVGLERLNVTVELNPFRRLRLIVEVPCPPLLTDRLVGLADKLKSRKLKVVVAEWVSDPLVPVMVRV